MILRTPRRRISPRTKLRCRAIKDFFRRAISSTSQQDIQINSSIAINVTNLKRKVAGLEEQLDQVNRDCRDIADLQHCFKTESELLYESELKYDIETIKEQTENTTTSSGKKSNGIETQLIYKSERECKQSEDSSSLPKSNNDNYVESNTKIINECNELVTKEKSKLNQMNDTNSNLHKHKTRSISDNVAAALPASSFHSLTNAGHQHLKPKYPSSSKNRDFLKYENINEITPRKYIAKGYKESVNENMGDFKRLPEDKPTRNRKSHRPTPEIDQDFIADIIRKQYKPTTMFGKRESDLSQVSAPICRDQEFPIRENLIADSELCSCLYGEATRPRRSKPRRHDVDNMRSVCDTRLYSSRKYTRPKYRTMLIDNYSNSEIYDFIPVKEKSSPKMRKKFVEDNRIPYEYYREVPPSPRTLRPQLNLKAQYCTEQDYIPHYKRSPKRRSPNRETCHREYMQQFESDVTSDVKPIRNATRLRKKKRSLEVPSEEHCMEVQNTGTMSSFPPNANEQLNNIPDTNRTRETNITVDKADKALYEIKDILQTFLREIKKDTVHTQSDKLDITGKTQDTEIPQMNPKTYSNVMPNTTSFNQYGPGQYNLPYMAPCTNQCCYQVMPVCPMACPMPMPNGCVMPSQSFTCTNCMSAPKESHSAQYCNKTTDTPCRNETDELIKEIYKFVAQSPTKTNGSENNVVQCKTCKSETKVLTNRSVGDSHNKYLNDANVGTPPLKCYSKSCEAICSTKITDAFYTETTNPSYSDTIIDKLSLVATTQSTTESELDSESSDPNKKTYKSKFAKVLRSFGLFKKKNKDIIEALSESESVTDLEVKPRKPPFRQEVTNYLMHRQEFNRPPPVEPHYHRQYRASQEDRGHDYRPGQHGYHLQPHDHNTTYEYMPAPHEYISRPNESRQPHHYSKHHDARGLPHHPNTQRHGQNMIDHRTAPVPPSKQHPSTSPYTTSYDTSSYSHMQPHLCVKEIEVKSTGTQSERKVSVFRRLRDKMQQPIMASPLAAGDEYQRTFSTQTPQIQQVNKPAPQVTKPLFNWKGLQAKAMQGMQDMRNNEDPMAYSRKTQKQLAAGDLKLRNAMMKKLFYKRNPFSPRNLIVRTLMGKDRSSFGEPPSLYRPRMFF